jgi:hypothetical protein
MFRGTGFSLFIRLLFAYHPKYLEELHANCGAASAALTIAGRGKARRSQKRRPTIHQIVRDDQEVSF